MIRVLLQQQLQIDLLQHDHISLIWVANARIADQAVPAITVPWYNHGNVLAYLQRYPAANKLDLVGLH